MVGFLTSNYALSYSDQLQVSTGLNSPACSTGSAFLKVTNNLHVAKSESILHLHPNQLLSKHWLFDCYFSLKLFLLLIVEHLCFSLSSHLSGFFFLVIHDWFPNSWQYMQFAKCSLTSTHWTSLAVHLSYLCPLSLLSPYLFSSDSIWPPVGLENLGIY